MQEYSEIMKRLQNESFIVYGAGSYAKRFLAVLSEMGIERNVEGFAISESRDIMSKIQQIDDVDREKLVVIAAHDYNAIDMENTLKQKNFLDYISISPYMIELCCGEPYKKNVSVRTNEIIGKYEPQNWVTIIYLAIDSIVKKNDFGRRMYFKMMSAVSTKETVLERWKILEAKVYFDKKDIIQGLPIKINPKQNFVLDGNHRLAIAKYFGVNQLFADYYNISFERYDEMFNMKLWTDEKLPIYFSKDEIELIYRTKDKLLNGG